MSHSLGRSKCQKTSTATLGNQEEGSCRSGSHAGGNSNSSSLCHSSIWGDGSWEPGGALFFKGTYLFIRAHMLIRALPSDMESTRQYEFTLSCFYLKEHLDLYQGNGLLTLAFLPPSYLFSRVQVSGRCPLSHFLDLAYSFWCIVPWLRFLLWF